MGNIDTPKKVRGNVAKKSAGKQNGHTPTSKAIKKSEVTPGIDIKENKTIGQKIDGVVHDVNEKVDHVGDKLSAAKKDASHIIHDISKNIKKTAKDTGHAVSDLVHEKSRTT